jgi:hypothetical protein
MKVKPQKYFNCLCRFMSHYFTEATHSSTTMATNSFGWMKAFTKFCYLSIMSSATEMKFTFYKTWTVKSWVCDNSAGKINWTIEKRVKLKTKIFCRLRNILFFTQVKRTAKMIQSQLLFYYFYLLSCLSITICVMKLSGNASESWANKHRYEERK